MRSRAPPRVIDPFPAVVVPVFGLISERLDEATHASELSDVITICPE